MRSFAAATYTSKVDSSGAYLSKLTTLSTEIVTRTAGRAGHGMGGRDDWARVRNL